MTLQYALSASIVDFEKFNLGSSSPSPDRPGVPGSAPQPRPVPDPDWPKDPVPPDFIDPDPPDFNDPDPPLNK